MLVTIHVGEQTRPPQILSRSGPLQASHAHDREELERGRIYVAPRGHHLIARDGHAMLSTGPRVNRHRPSVDVMFASGADWVDGHTVAVVLSGALDDGAVGAALVDLAGGQVLVQDPVEAEFNGMPVSALAAASRARSFSASRLALEIRDCLARAKSGPSHRKAYEARMEADMDMISSDNPAFSPRRRVPAHPTHLPRLWRRDSSSGSAKRSVTSAATLGTSSDNRLSPRRSSRLRRGSCGVQWLRWRSKQPCHHNVAATECLASQP